MLELYEIPTLPEELKQAALDGTLVIFVGAGASRLLDCPSWDGLADLVLESLEKVEIITCGALVAKSSMPGHLSIPLRTIL